MQGGSETSLGSAASGNHEFGSPGAVPGTSRGPFLLSCSARTSPILYLSHCHAAATMVLLIARAEGLQKAVDAIMVNDPLVKKAHLSRQRSTIENLLLTKKPVDATATIVNDPLVNNANDRAQKQAIKLTSKT